MVDHGKQAPDVTFQLFYIVVQTYILCIPMYILVNGTLRKVYAMLHGHDVDMANMYTCTVGLCEMRLSLEGPPAI